MKLFLIDGHALIFKMYYAFLGRPMINSKGVDTSILFGFTKYLLEMINREQPTHLAVSFDPPGGTFRNEMYPEYKANRGETPQLVIDALDPLTAIVKAMDIPVLMVRGYEADDVIGTVALKFAGRDMDVYMVTPDKDYGQLVRTDVLQYKPGKSGTDNEVLGPREICEKWGISDPKQVIDILAICGDSSDNVPGVNGVGPVGASKLLGKYGSVEEIYNHLDELSPRQREMFGQARDHIVLSKELVTIRTDVPVDVTVEEMKLGPVGGRRLRELFDLYEFNSLKRFLRNVVEDEASPAQSGTASELIVPKAARCALKDISGKEVAINYINGALYVACGGMPEFSVAECPVQECRHLLEDGSVSKFCYGVKPLLKQLERDGITISGRLFDVEIMHYVLDPEKSHRLADLSTAYFGLCASSGKTDDEESLFGDADRTKDEYMLETAHILAIGRVLCGELSASGMEKVYRDIEEPLIPVLARMEEAGVKVDLSSLAGFAQELRVEMLRSEARVRELAGEPELNVASPKQIGEVIFEKMQLDPRAKKPAKGNWPTDEETLSSLSDRSPIIEAILDYRGSRKLLSTYIEPFGQYVSARDGRVHTTFNQAMTATGRLSSSNPNLQNIPIRTDQGKKIRAAFVPQDEGSVIMSADYSQIELRIMAHLSCDRHLIEAFNAGEDVHAATASKIFSVPVSEVSSDQRRIAKTANFGIMYGISSFGLAQRLGCSRSEAKKIIDDYFESFPSIRSFINDTLASARETGYVETIFARRRYVPELNSHNANIRAFAERNAVNAPIQGSSADIIKLAMAGVDRRLSQAGLKARMVLQIHDELLLEVPVDEIDRVKDIVVGEMENVVKLSIPLSVECSYGRTWLEAHQ